MVLGGLNHKYLNHFIPLNQSQTRASKYTKPCLLFGHNFGFFWTGLNLNKKGFVSL